MNLTKEPHNFLFRPIDPNRLEQKVIQYLEVDLRDRRISAWRQFVDERLKRLLGNNNLINYE
jgi:hypothetical protein